MPHIVSTLSKNQIESSHPTYKIVSCFIWKIIISNLGSTNLHKFAPVESHASSWFPACSSSRWQCHKAFTAVGRSKPRFMSLLSWRLKFLQIPFDLLKHDIKKKKKNCWLSILTCDPDQNSKPIDPSTPTDQFLVSRLNLLQVNGVESQLGPQKTAPTILIRNNIKGKDNMIKHKHKTYKVNYEHISPTHLLSTFFPPPPTPITVRADRPICQRCQIYTSAQTVIDLLWFGPGEP